MSSDLGGNQRGRNRALERLKANGLGEVLNQLFLFFFFNKIANHSACCADTAVARRTAQALTSRLPVI